MPVRLTVHSHAPSLGIPSIFQPLISMSLTFFNVFFFLRPIYISFLVPYFVYCMLIQMNVCFVYLEYKVASQIDNA